MKKPPESVRFTPIEHALQPLVDAERYLEELKALVHHVHPPECPFLRGISFCDCVKEPAYEKELEALAMGFANTHMDSAAQIERLIFAAILVRTLKKAWELGHKDSASPSELLELEALLGVQGGRGVVQRVKQLLAAEKHLEDHVHRHEEEYDP